MVSRVAIAAAASTLALALLPATPGVLTALLYAPPREVNAVEVDFERAYEAAFASGFHSRERDGRDYFRWSRAQSFLTFQNLPEGEVEVEASLRVRRPSGEPLPQIVFTANGVTVHRTMGLPGTAEYRFSFPNTASKLVLGLEADTFHVGPEGDEGRDLGIQALGFRLLLPTETGTRAGLAPALLIALAGAIWFVALLVSGIPKWLASLLSAGMVLAFVGLLAQGGLRFSGYAVTVVAIALGALALATVLRLVLDRASRASWLDESRRCVLIAVIVALFAVKVAAVSFPFFVTSDGDFQANRMLHFLRGNWHPTSVTQHEEAFVIPYPVSMYAVATPLVGMGLSRLTSLELLAAILDAVVGFGLAVIGARFLDDLRAGIAAGWLYAMVPMNVNALSAGNFTNLFAVGMGVLALIFFLLGAAEGSRRDCVLAGVFSLLAVTAHFGWLLEGALLLPGWLLIAWLMPAPVGVDRRWFLTAALGVAGVAACLYYSGYAGLVAEQWRRLLPGRERVESASGLGSVSGLGSLADSVGTEIGWVLFVAALLGGVQILRRPGRNLFHAAASVWVVVTVLFLILDLATPLEIRYLLQALPLLALMAASYLSQAWERGPIGKTVAVVAIAYLSSAGGVALYESMFVRYH